MVDLPWYSTSPPKVVCLYYSSIHGKSCRFLSTKYTGLESDIH